MIIPIKQALDYLNYCMDKDYIDRNDFENVYEDLQYRSDFIKKYKINIFSIPYLTSTVTSLLLEAGINPLNYLKSIPRYYLCENTEITTFTIPKNIHYISDYAFRSCSNLKSIILPKNIVDIGINSFEDCPKLIEVIYEGTKEEWSKLQRINKILVEEVLIKKIICSDGVIEVEGNNLNINIEDIDEKDS